LSRLRLPDGQHSSVHVPYCPCFPRCHSPVVRHCVPERISSRCHCSRIQISSPLDLRFQAANQSHQQDLFLMKNGHDQRRTSCASPSDHDNPLGTVRHSRTTKTGVAFQAGCDPGKGKSRWAREGYRLVLSNYSREMNTWVTWSASVLCQTPRSPPWSQLDWASVNGFDYRIGTVNGNADGSRTAPRLLRSHHSPQPPACPRPVQDERLAHPYPVQNRRQDQLVAYSQKNRS
jgi:hypothetical protein